MTYPLIEELKRLPGQKLTTGVFMRPNLTMPCRAAMLLLDRQPPEVCVCDETLSDGHISRHSGQYFRFDRDLSSVALRAYHERCLQLLGACLPSIAFSWEEPEDEALRFLHHEES